MVKLSIQKKIDECLNDFCFKFYMYLACNFTVTDDHQFNFQATLNFHWVNCQKK
jgi:hypothetical protein